MKIVFSYSLLLYLFVLILSPVHASSQCDHDEANIEQHESDHADNQCCPPFSVCKVCSLFVNQTEWLFAAASFDVTFQQNPLFIASVYISAEVHIWQPPKLI
nr:hypothetical protein [Cytophagales bacterium]